MTLFRLFLSLFAFSFVCSETLSTEKRGRDCDEEVLTQPQVRESLTLISEDTLTSVKVVKDKRPKTETTKKHSPKNSAAVQKTNTNVSLNTPPPTSRPTQNAISAPKNNTTDKFYITYCEIMKKGRYPIQPIQSITAQEEDRDGSRKWVKSYNDPQSHSWHKQRSVIIKEMRRVNDETVFVPVETNFAMAQLTFVLTEGKEPVVREIPFFFISGWPANKNKDSISAFAKKLLDGKVSAALEPYKTYGLSFVASVYQGGEEQQLRKGGFGPYKMELGSILEKELHDPNRIISEARLKSHINLVESSDTSILGKLYLHSEQSIWYCVQDEIRKFRGQQRQISSQNIKNHFTKDTTDPIDHVKLDICTYYDMCWCCGDTMASCSHTLNLGAKVLIRVTGCVSYYDQPLNKVGPMRNHRTEFPGYEAGTAFEMVPHFRPYIAHAMKEDLL